MEEEIDWDQEADNWTRWARTPGHDAYWHYRDSFFDEIIPPPGRCTVEVGCGEGRVLRDLQKRGHRVVGIDRSRRLLHFAKDSDPSGVYMLANAASLPLANASCDLVVAYNSLMDVADLPREAARVLEPGGRMCVCVTHPLSNAGTFLDAEPDSAFYILGVLSVAGDFRKPSSEMGTPSRSEAGAWRWRITCGRSRVLDFCSRRCANHWRLTQAPGSRRGVAYRCFSRCDWSSPERGKRRAVSP